MASILYGDNMWHRIDDKGPPLDGQVIVCSPPAVAMPKVWVAEDDAPLPKQAYAWRCFPRDSNEGWLGRADLARFIPMNGRLWICIRGEDWAGRFSGSKHPLVMIEPRLVADRTWLASEEPSLLDDESIEAFMPITAWERGDIFDPARAGARTAEPKSPIRLQSLSENVRLYVAFS